MKKSLFENFFEKIKTFTDQGVLLKIRSTIGYILDLIINFDIWLKVYFLLPRKRTGQTQASSKRVGILSMYRPIFWHGNLFEMHINKKLKELGYFPIHILCRGILEICDVQTFKSDKFSNPIICVDCRLRNDLFYGKNNSESIYLDSYVDKGNLEDIFRTIDQLPDISSALQFIYKEKKMGKWVHLSVCRYWMRLTLNNAHLSIYKRFLKSAVMLYEGFEKLLSKHEFDNFLIFNGRYTTFRVPLEIIKNHGIKFSTYELGEQEKFMFTSNDITVMWNDVPKRFNSWLHENPIASNEIRNKVNNYMRSREKNVASRYVDLSNNAINFKTDIAVFTNLIWDSAAFERDTIFNGQFDWISELIQWLKKQPDLSMTIRIHPAEISDVYNKTNEKMFDFIQSQYPVLPKNVRVIEPSDSRSSYQILDHAKVITVYSSSIGLESALKGKTVIMAGSTHYAMKGLTIRPSNKVDYFNQLENVVRNGEIKPDIEKTILYTYWYYKIYHRLNNTNLSQKPFMSWEDSRMIRVPHVSGPADTTEFNDLVLEFIKGSNP